MRNDGRAILYVAGVADMVGTFDYWSRGEDDPRELAVTYSAQFWNTCHRLGFLGKAIAWSSLCRTASHERQHVEERRIYWQGTCGAKYHLGKVVNNARVLWWALRTRPMMVLVANPSHGWVLAPLRLTRIRVVATLHNALWDSTKGPKKGLLGWLERFFYRHVCNTVLCVSDQVAKQAESFMGGRTRTVQFRPSFQRSRFELRDRGIRGRDDVFTVLFAGRLVRAKGIFDLIDVADTLRREGTRVRFSVCGSGEDRGSLERAITARGLEDWFVLHGHCNADAMGDHLAAAHAVIVPTRSEYPEGMNKVVLEGILAGLPVISSSVCPAIEVGGQAVIAVEPNSVRGYADAIRGLVDSEDAYRARVTASHAVREQLFGEDLSFGRAVEVAVGRL